MKRKVTEVEVQNARRALNELMKDETFRKKLSEYILIKR
jgi:hypothetical protein